MPYKNWQLKIDDAQIAWLYFDCENSSVNTLNSAAMGELDQILDEILKLNPVPQALVILSAKAAGFCMGANINEFAGNADLAQLRSHVERGQRVMQKIEDLPFTSIALIHGFCVGGGLELALACRYRIARSDTDTQLGFPEVRLGLQPAWGGSVRLPRLIHPLQALNLMLSGRSIKAVPAKRLGLVDVIVPQRQMQNATRYVIAHPIKRSDVQLMQMACRIPLVRRLVAMLVRKQVKKQADPRHYPAPYMIIDAWERDGAQGPEAYKTEVDHFMRLLETDTAKNLIRIFFLQEQLKAVGKKTADKVQRVHVVGAGTMGGDIAAWCMLKGFTVSLQDRNAAALQNAMQRAYQLCVAQIKDPRKIKYVMDKLIPDVEGAGILHADIIIEAIFEDLAVKQELLRSVEAKAQAHAIIATNTSSISLDDLKSVLPDPSRLVGIHFFNPVAKMQLVEVVHTDGVDPDISARALAFVHHIGKLPLKVKNCPGFLVNRIISAYLLETAHLIKEGVAIGFIDKTLQDFGMLMGPVAMMDLVGLDICIAVVKNLGGEVPAVLQEKVAAGHLGKKSGEGFYRYKNGKLQHTANTDNGTSMPADEVRDRLMLALINECVACSSEGIVDSADELDAGAIFGMGFAPFRGGPMQYAKARGLQNIYQQLQQYESTLGERFVPKAGWKDLVKSL